MALFWTAKEIRKIAAEEAANVFSGRKAAEITRKHVSNILREAVVAEGHAELRVAVDKLVEDAKLMLYSKLSVIYSSQCEKVEQNLRHFERDLEKREPDQRRRLEGLERRLHDLQLCFDEWIDAPKQQLDRAAAEHRQAFSEELGKLAKDSATRVKAMITRVEQQIADLIVEKLHNLLIEAVSQHVTSTPFAPTGMSNKQIAAARHISLREVKRLRRMGLA